MHKPGELYSKHNLCRFAVAAFKNYAFKEGWQSWTRLDDGPLKQAKMGKGYIGFCADPFLFRYKGENWLFYETVTKEYKGVLGCFKEIAGEWRQQGVVLAEPFHLSYPQVFEEDGHVYMIPESGDQGRGVVALYESTDFPRGWVKRQVLIQKPYADSSLLRKDGHYYLACYTNELGSAELWHADKLTGPWTLHPQSQNMNQSRRLRRCGGSWLMEDGRLYRIVQDCNGGYGKRVFKVPVVAITPNEYKEGDAMLMLDTNQHPQGRKHTYNEIRFDGHKLSVFDVRADYLGNLLCVVKDLIRATVKIVIRK